LPGERCRPLLGNVVSRAVFLVDWLQFAGATSNAFGDVSQGGPDPSGAAIIAMHDQPNARVRRRRWDDQTGQSLLSICAKACQAGQAAAVERRRDRGFMATRLQGDTGARRQIGEPAHPRSVLNVVELRDQMMARASAPEI
jgi:hypothetical protein